MAFSEGQMYFALTFFVIFVIVMIIAYRSDIKKLGIHAKGAGKVLALILFVMLLFWATVKFLAS